MAFGLPIARGNGSVKVVQSGSPDWTIFILIAEAISRCDAMQCVELPGVGYVTRQEKGRGSSDPRRKRYFPCCGLARAARTVRRICRAAIEPAPLVRRRVSRSWRRLASRVVELQSDMHLQSVSTIDRKPRRQLTVLDAIDKPAEQFPFVAPVSRPRT